MKTSETKTSANTVTHAKNTVSPFFSKEGQGGTSFFGGETMAAESFFSPRTIQPKLTIGKPNDVYEQQADSVADQVVAKLNAPQTPSVPPTLKGSPTVQPKCAACEKEEKLQKKEEDIAPVGEQVQMKPIFDSAAEPPPDDTVQRKCAECEKEEAVQRKTDGNTEGAASPDLSSRLNASKGGGQPLPADTRTSMESAMGADFSNVRVHTGSEAVQMSQGINAQAFTHGSDVYFNEGKFNPSNTEGTRLLAHELTHTVQQGGVQRKLIQTKKEHEHKEDGQGVKKRMHSKVQDEVGDDADFSKSPGQMTDEECKKAKDIDQGKKSQQKAAIKSGGAAKPDVNRPAKEMPKVKGAAEEGKGKMAQPPKQKGGKGKKKEASRAKLESSDAKERSALAAYAKSAKLLMPLKPAELTAPRIEKPKDSKGEEVPANTALDKSVQALHEIAKLFYENAFELKEQAVNDAQEGLKMRGTLDESWAKTRRVTAGSEVMKQDKDAREKINQQEEEALVKVEADTAMVKEGAPRMMEESTKGKDEAGPMVAETTAQKSEMEANVPDDEDAAAEAQKQSEDTGKAADDSQKMDDTLGQTGVRAEKYLQDAVAGEAKNQGTRATIDENKGTLANIGQEISRIDKHNAKSEAQLGALDSYPELVEKQTAKRAESGDQLYAAAVTMNDQLISTQEEYLSSMAALPGKEEAMKKQQEEDAANKKEEPAEEVPLSPEEEMLLNMGNMNPEELDAALMSMDEEELQKLNTTLGGMPTQEEKKEESLIGKPDEAGRSKVDLMKAFDGKDEQAPPDPRQEQIDEIENQRAARIGEVKQLSDVNFTYLSAEQKQMLAQKLAMKDAVSGLFDINILDMGKGMIMGMINPLESLKGVVDGASKLATGVVNLFNAAAWAKDPLGNLLQSSADIATGLTMILMSITGIATAITIIMVAITIASFGFAAPFTGPVIAFMATVISTVGGWTIVTGLIALALNALTYIKNLHDAGVAENTDQLVTESGQIKQNMTDGFTSAMAVVGAKGDKAGAQVMKGKIGAAGGAKNFAKQMGTDFKEGLVKGASKVGGMVAKGAKAVKAFTKDGITKVKSGIQKAIQKAKGGLDDIGAGAKKGWGDLKEKLGGKGKKTDLPDAPSNVKTPKDGGDLGNVGGQKVKAETDLPDGHKGKVLEDGQCAICSDCKTIRKKFGPELRKNKKLSAELKKLEADLKANPKNKKLLDRQIQIHDELLDAKAKRIKRKYDKTNPTGEFDEARVRQELAEGKEFDIETGRFGNPDKTVSSRQKYVGSTPGKDSATGQKVMDRMNKKGKMKNYPPYNADTEFFDRKDKKWYNASEADMGHYKKSTVDYWNETGKYKGAKSPEVREWMLESENYELEHFSRNRSAGASSGKTYDPPEI